MHSGNQLTQVLQLHNNTVGGIGTVDMATCQLHEVDDITLHWCWDHLKPNLNLLCVRAVGSTVNTVSIANSLTKLGGSNYDSL